MSKIKARDNPLHWRWGAMKQRCYNPNNEKFSRYGGRGISVCKEWFSFPMFEKWALENGYKPELTLDRIDTDGNYNPNNCRWVDQRAQQNNRNNNRKIIYEDKEYTFSELSEKTGLKIETIAYRIKENIPVDSDKNFHHAIVEIDGESKNLRQWCNHFNKPYKTIHARITRGWEPERAILTPIRKGNYK